jgi:hypothetical protein
MVAWIIRGMVIGWMSKEDDSIKKNRIIGLVIFTLIIFVLASTFMGLKLTWKEASEASMNNGNNTSSPNDNFNNINQTSVSPMSIPLEKPPFIH